MMKIKEQLGISIALQLFVIILLIFKMSAAYLMIAFCVITVLNLLYILRSIGKSEKD